MTATAQHRLEGLEPDNLLALLALLGLLRSLEVAGVRPRAHWEGVPLRPVLSLPDPMTEAAVAEGAAKGSELLAQDHDFDGEKNLAFDATRARSFLKAAIEAGSRTRAALYDCLFSDGATKDDGTVLAAPLCSMFGQGHQHFLSRLTDVPRGVLPKALQKRKPQPNLNAPEKLAAALFLPWTRDDETDSFRWDPAEDRRYALRYRNPSQDAGRTMHGANRLAAVGLAALPGAPVKRRRGVRFLTLGTEVGHDGSLFIVWPIWNSPASLSAIQALVGHPDLVAGEMSALRRFGVIERRRARRVANGKFMNFTRAEVV
jgi:hypothetical protein